MPCIVDDHGVSHACFRRLRQLPGNRRLVADDGKWKDTYGAFMDTVSDPAADPGLWSH